MRATVSPVALRPGTKHRFARINTDLIYLDGPPPRSLLIPTDHTISYAIFGNFPLADRL